MLYTLLDLETTGIGTSDRLVEIGLLQFDEAGRRIRQFETLLDPQVPIPNTSFHGIGDPMVEKAPTFQQILPVVEDYLSRCDYLLAFNIGFDWRMLGYEYANASRALPSPQRLCLSKHFSRHAPQAPRRVKDLCRYYRVELEDPQRSLERMKSMHLVLCQILDTLPTEDGRFTRDNVRGVEQVPVVTRRDTGGRRPVVNQPILERLTSRLPRNTQSVTFEPYFELLDDVFADSVLEPKEALSLFLLASELGMSKEDTDKAHQAYLDGLLEVAYKDGYYTEMEAEHLEAVAKALQVEELVLQPKGAALALYPRDLKGKTVSFTGTPRGVLDGERVTRRMIEDLAGEAGMSVEDSVGDELDFLVVSDLEVDSEKLKEARALGVSEVTEQVFWNWMGLQVR